MLTAVCELLCCITVYMTILHGLCRHLNLAYWSWFSV